MTRTLTHAAIVAIWLAFPATGHGQESSIIMAQALDPNSAVAAKGQVLGPSNEPQAGVPVQIKGPLGQTVAITDKSGTWSLYNLPAGNYKAQMIAPDKSNAPDAVDFTVQEPSFWQKFGNGQRMVVSVPKIKLNAMP